MLPNQYQRTWLQRLGRIPLSTPDFCRLIKMDVEEFYDISNGKDMSVNRATEIEIYLEALEKGAEDL